MLSTYVDGVPSPEHRGLSGEFATVDAIGHVSFRGKDDLHASENTGSAMIRRQTNSEHMNKIEKQSQMKMELAKPSSASLLEDPPLSDAAADVGAQVPPQAAVSTTIVPATVTAPKVKSAHAPAAAPAAAVAVTTTPLAKHSSASLAEDPPQADAAASVDAQAPPQVAVAAPSQPDAAPDVGSQVPPQPDAAPDVEAQAPPQAVASTTGTTTVVAISVTNAPLAPTAVSVVTAAVTTTVIASGPTVAVSVVTAAVTTTVIASGPTVVAGGLPSGGEMEIDAKRTFNGDEPCDPSGGTTFPPPRSTACAPIAETVVAPRNAGNVSATHAAIRMYLDCLGEDCEDADFHELEEVLLLGVHSCAELLANSSGDCHYDLSLRKDGKHWPDNTLLGSLCSGTCRMMCRRPDSYTDADPQTHPKATPSADRRFGADRPPVNGTPEDTGLDGGPEGDMSRMDRKPMSKAEAHMAWLKQQTAAVAKPGPANDRKPANSSCDSCEEAAAEAERNGEEEASTTTSTTTSQQVRPQ